MFDYLVDHHKVQKVETAGDCYIVAGGIMAADDEGFYQVRGQLTLSCQVERRP